MALSEEDVRDILRIIDSSELDELRVETRGFRLHVRRGGAPPTGEESISGQEIPAESAGEGERDSAATGEEPTGEMPPVGPPQRVGDGARSGRVRPSRDGARTITAPMLGTFYRAEGPGAEPFVEVGSRVEPGTVVGIIEVMKMMNTVRAGISGTIVEICAENAELIEEGQPLFRVEPA